MKRKINKIIEILKSEGFVLVENAEKPMSYDVSKSGNLSVMDNWGNYFYFSVKKYSFNNSYTLGSYDKDTSSFEDCVDSLCAALWGDYITSQNDCLIRYTAKSKKMFEEIMK